METALEAARKCPKVNCENSENTDITLPEEIATDIISRLPVKQIFQLQCLSKNFASITNDLNFIDAHLGHSSCLRPSVILNKGNDIYLIQSNGIDSEAIVEEVPLREIIDLTNYTERLKIEASCNGLVILSVGDRDCFIWNPSTVKCNKLPSPWYVDGMYCFATWGFGYCTKSSQYKIVRTAYYLDDYVLGSRGMVVEVLSYCTDYKWRRLDFSNFYALCDGPGVTIKGIVYWTLEYRVLFSDNCLLSFDLEKEEFVWITCPFSICEKIMEFQGSLAVCARQTRKYSFDVWVLKESWENIYTTVNIHPYLPIRFLNDHQLFLVEKDKRVYSGRNKGDSVEFSCSLYDMERKEIKGVPGLLECNTTESNVLNFAQSMVPLLS